MSDERKLVGLDIDGVLADFNLGYVQLLKDLTGRNLFPDQFDIPCWDYPKTYGYTKEETRASWTWIGNSTQFWYELEPYAGISGQIARLKDEVDLFFITSRLGDTAQKQTEMWLERYCDLKNPRVIVSDQKAKHCRENRADFYIDDKFENCVDVRDNARMTKCFMRARTWNSPLFNVPRVGSLKEFVDEVLK